MLAVLPGFGLVVDRTEKQTLAARHILPGDEILQLNQLGSCLSRTRTRRLFFCVLFFSRHRQLLYQDACQPSESGARRGGDAIKTG